VARLHERAAREVLLLRAYESQNTDAQESHVWTRADSDWANRVATESVGPSGSAQAFIEARAHAAMQRLAPRDEGVRRALQAPAWRWAWVSTVGLAAVIVGAVIYDVGTHQRIDLLSVPVWLVVLWNLVVYVWLLVHALRGWGERGDGHAGKGLRRFIARHLASRLGAAPRKTPALASYATAWAQASWPMMVARAGAVLHVGAAGLALGLIGGMYLRGLVLDYRAGWQSTFLEPATAHQWLSTMLAPAAALTRTVLPDVQAIAALRVLPGHEAQGLAGPWIHWMAATLAIFVVAPRLLMALGSVWRGRWLARKLPIAIDDPYHHRLLQQHVATASHVRVHAHGAMPDAAAALGLQKLITRVFGDKAELALAPLATYGEEHAAASTSSFESDTVKLALFDLSATPEAEAQGRFMRELKDSAARGTAVLMLVDQTAFHARFGVGAPERANQRRAAWEALAATLDLPPPVFLSLATLDVDQAARALESALQLAS
jgi:hypothetical protein